jgi:phosphatidylserine/phosphatidylglycerophosphate/cardiolipin synthase-like enzyme
MSLTELKAKWFIPTDGSSPDGVPCHRGPGGAASPLSVSTDGNTVKWLIDGEDYMRAWRDGLLALVGQPEARFYHAGWRFERMKALGANAPEGDILEDICNARDRGVGTYVLACSNLRCFRFNYPAIRYLRSRGVRTAHLDRRIPLGASNHQKFTVFKSGTEAHAILGSVDISWNRWDSSEHLPFDPNRDPKYGQQTHDVSVSIEGPAIADLEATFAERWNDLAAVASRGSILRPEAAITPSFPQPLGRGTHSVQVLRTYGISKPFVGYSWAPWGEFTIWASYLNAIKRATECIYIEDQFFWPFGWPPGFTRTGLARDTDLVYQLGEAMKRGVDLVVVTTSVPTGVCLKSQKYLRDAGINYLHDIRSAGSPGNFIVAAIQRDGGDIYVHSKLMIVDDEFVSIGTANIARRSMANDGEIQVGIVDEAGFFAQRFRSRLMAEHIGVPAPRLSDPGQAFDAFRHCVTAGLGRLKPYPVNPLASYKRAIGSTLPRAHAAAVTRGLDPYAGPPALR